MDGLSIDRGWATDGSRLYYLVGGRFNAAAYQVPATGGEPAPLPIEPPVPYNRLILGYLPGESALLMTGSERDRIADTQKGWALWTVPVSAGAPSRISSVEALGGAAHEIIPDRIEAGTYMVAAALTRGDIILDAVRPAHMQTIIEKLRYSGANIETLGPQVIRITGRYEIRPQDITTSPYPGFPTDMQAQFMVLMTQALGTSIITETIFDRRFLHVNELLRLGAIIVVSGDKAVVHGRTPLSGAEVTATDLRASASLILAGLIAQGTTTVNEVEHIDRGYESIEEKLKGLGARIDRIKE